MRRRRESIAFICGTMSPGGLEAFTQLVEQAPRWLDVHLIGYTPAGGDTEREPVVVNGRTFEHIIYDQHDLTDFDFPNKYGGQPGKFKLVPGNTDLLQIRFARDHPGYRRYWSVEDDVRFAGNWADVFKYFRKSKADLLATTIRRRPTDPRWFWWKDLAAPDGQELPKKREQLAAFLPFTGVSPAAFEAISAGYREGWAGHYESLWPTLLRRTGLIVQDIGGDGEWVAPGDENRFYVNTPRKHLSPGTFVYRPYIEDYDRESGHLWHPIREGLSGHPEMEARA